MFGKRYSCEAPNCAFISSITTSSLLGSDTLLNTLFSKTPSLNDHYTEKNVQTECVDVHDIYMLLYGVSFVMIGF
jgi:hypothetical protein